MAIKKKFIEIDLPLLGMSTSILGTQENVVGKRLKLDLTRKLRGKSLEIVFKIYNKEGIYALPKRLEILKFFIRRVMRKRASYIEDSFKSKCKDVEVTIKPFLVTRKRVSRAIRNHLRRVCKETIVDYIKEKTYLQICEDLLSGTLQKTILPKLKKVYPLSFSDLRVFETEELDKIDYTYVKEKVVKKIEEILPEEEIVEEEPVKEIKEESESAKEEIKEDKPAKKAKKTKSKEE